MESSRILTFAGGLALGALGMWLWYAHPQMQQTLGDTDIDALTSTSTPVTESSTSGAVSVADQAAGNSVLITSVTVPPPGVWVAVREVVGNDLGNVLGATRVRAPMSNVTVQLLRNTIPGQTYAVMLYRDDGDNIFDHNVDSVYVDYDTGERVVVYFHAK